MSRAFQGMAVINVPVVMKDQIKKAGKIKRILKKKPAVEQIQEGDFSNLLITCKRKEFNMYKGQTFDKFDTIRLASQGWYSRKSKGDFFTIHKHGKNPAFLNDDNILTSFEELGLDERISSRFQNLGFTQPTNIQRLAIPHILNGGNTLVAAETGNGKTYAFVAPLIHQILKLKNQVNDRTPLLNAPQAIVIVPGRELVIQTRDMARVLGSDLGININSIVGGRSKRLMLNPRFSYPDLVIASLGALSKLTTVGIYKLDNVNHIVLDEVDTLLDDSFNEKTTHFLSKFSIKGRSSTDAESFDNLSGIQLTLVGATLPRSINTILDKIVDVESLVQVKTPLLHRISPHVPQTFIKVGTTSKAEVLLRLAKQNYNNKIPTIIFSNTSKCCDWVSIFLNQYDIPCVNMNGAMKFALRCDKFKSFQENRFSFISCTDLASRGLNSVRAQHIINFEFPKYISDYIHRCGRTGRVGAHKQCGVTNLISHPDEVALAQKIEYAARKLEDLPNVNANIKRILLAKEMKQQINQMSST